MAQKTDHFLLRILIIKVLEQWLIDFEKVSPSLLSAAQFTLTGLYICHLRSSNNIQLKIKMSHLLC